MKRILQLFCLTFIVAVFSMSAMAQDAAQKVISPEKKKLIAEIVVATKMDKQMAQITDVMLASSESIHAAALRQALDKHPEWSQKDRDAYELVMLGRLQSFVAKFRERLPGAIDYNDFIEKVIYPVYDKTFTEKELADLLAFYKSETGQKMLVSMPTLMAEAMEAGQKVLLPKVFKLVDDIMAEELSGLKAPAPGKNQ